MIKNHLFLLATATSILTIGVGCTARVPNNQTNTNNNATASATAVVATTTDLTTAFSIRELGITFDIPMQYKDELAYEIKQAEPNGPVAYMYSKRFILKDIMGNDSNCEPGEIGAITKNKTLYTMTGDTRAPDPRTDIKVGDEYVTIDGPQDLCTSNKELQKSLEELSKMLRRTITTVRVMPN